MASHGTFSRPRTAGFLGLPFDGMMGVNGAPWRDIQWEMINIVKALGASSTEVAPGLIPTDWKLEGIAWQLQRTNTWHSIKLLGSNGSTK